MPDEVHGDRVLDQVAKHLVLIDEVEEADVAVVGIEGEALQLDVVPTIAFDAAGHRRLDGREFGCAEHAFENRQAMVLKEAFRLLWIACGEVWSGRSVHGHALLLD